MKISILGAGHIATKMAAAIRSLDNVEAYAVASRDKEKAAAFAKEYGFSKYYGSYEELVNDEAVDLIYIATPHSKHYEHGMLCAKHKKNILVEKAFCSNGREAAALVDYAEKQGILLVEALWTRFLPAVETIKSWLNTIGEVQFVEGEFSLPLAHIERLKKTELAGGALLDLGIYPLTFASLFIGEELLSIDSQSIPYKTGVDASSWMILNYKNNKHAYLKTSFISPDRNEGTIYGTNGFVRVKNLNDMVELKLFNGDGKLVQEHKPEPICNFYEYEVIACAKAIEKRKKGEQILELPEIPHSLTLQMMDILDSLRENWNVWYPSERTAGEIWNRKGNKSILQIYDLETRSVKVLKKFDDVIEAPNWSRDGKFLTYNSNGRIFKYFLETGEISEVPSYYVDNCNNDHVLAPDDKSIFVSHHTKEDGLSRIYEVFFDGSAPRLVTPLGPSYLHGISPDGKTLSYCAERNHEYDIYTIPSAGGLETRLTNARGLNDGPEFSFDGKKIWFNSVRSGKMQAYQMNVDGSEQKQMTFDLEFNTWFPHIAPDNQKVVMVAYHKEDVKPGEHVPNKNVEIRLMKPDGSELETLLVLFGGQGTINVNSFDPTSRYFAFVSYEL